MTQSKPIQPPQASSSASTQTNSLAVAGFVLAFTAPPIGLIFSIIGLVKANKYNGNGKTLSIIGIVVSTIMSFLTLFMIIVLVAASFDNIKHKSEEAAQKTAAAAYRYNTDKSKKLELGDVYTEATGVYSVKLPKGWKVENVKQNEVYVHEIANPILSDVSIKYSKANPNETLISTVNSLENEDNMTIKSKGSLTINGISGYEIVAHRNNLVTYLVSLTKANMTYSLFYVTSPEHSENYMPVFKASAQSFVVK